MKIFAIMLLMLCSFSFLKAQTMVVETVDTVESFEVGEIKNLSVFEKRYSKVKIELKKIPIVIRKIDSTEENFLYSSWQLTGDTKSKLYFSGDTVIGSSGVPYMNYAFILEVGPTGSGSDGQKSIKIIFQDNAIKDFFLWTSGSRGGCEYNAWLHCSIYGVFKIGLKNIPYKLNPSGSIEASLQKKEISASNYFFQHNEKEYVESKITRTADFLKIREEDLTDESQIIITIE